PLVRVLRELVYVEVRLLGRTDPNIHLVLDDCWATSTPSPLSKPQWSLLVDGCPYKEDNYLTSLIPVNASSGLINPTHYKRFQLKMFAFVNGLLKKAFKDPIFLYCSAAACSPSASDSCTVGCPSGGSK
ncbi:ZP4 protein, partial [Polyodon spathula]|nr:ZP4 protein [Polyodon spathula]